MKPLFWLALSLACFIAVAIVEDAPAADQLIEFTSETTVSRVDRNGNPYVRFIMPETRELSGHEYTVGVPVMAFGELAQEAASYPPGAVIKAVARHSKMPDGRESYSIIDFLE